VDLLQELSLFCLEREMSNSILIAIVVTSLATYLSRFLGVISSERIKETSKMFRWFNCLAYSTLAALIARIVIFPSGVLSEIDHIIRFVVVVLSIGVFFLTKKNLVYPTLFSAMILSLFSSYL
jgi:branched-subunit amino acid transport protein